MLENKKGAATCFLCFREWKRCVCLQSWRRRISKIQNILFFAPLGPHKFSLSGVAQLSGPADP